MHEELHHPQLGCRIGVLGQPLGVQPGGVDVHSRAGLEQIDRRQADEQADQGQAQEQQHGLAQQAPQGALVAHAGDTGDDGAEHHGGDHHLDQLDEGISQRLQGNGLRGPEVPHQDPEEHGAEDLEIERFNNFHGITHF